MKKSKKLLASKKIISGSDYKRLVKEKFSYGFPTVSVTQPSDSTGNTNVVVGYIRVLYYPISILKVIIYLYSIFPTFSNKTLI